MEKLILLRQIAQYKELMQSLSALSEQEKLNTWRTLAKNDLFFLLVYVLGVSFANNQWVLDRCREYQADPYGHLDLWARGHYKSTIITFAGTIFEIINDPEITIGIFSHKLRRNIAKQGLL